MATTVKLEGLKELEAALSELPKSTSKAVLRRVGIRALAPVISTARQLVPVDEGQLRDSLRVTTRLSRRQQRLNRKRAADEKAGVELFAGAAALPHAHLVEFGTFNQPARPFLRPAWDANKGAVLKTIQEELGSEIEKTAARLARRAARRAAKAAKG